MRLLNISGETKVKRHTAKVNLLDLLQKREFDGPGFHHFVYT